MNTMYILVAYNKEDVTSLFKKSIIKKMTVRILEGDVYSGISHIKSSRCNVYGVVYSHHFIHASHKLHVFLSLLFSSLVYHG